MTIHIDANEQLATWRHISEIGGFPLYRGRARRGDVVIRWGANHGRYDYADGVRVLNPKLVLSKVVQGELFEEAGVSIPKIYRRRRDWERDGSPQLVVKPDVGQMGTGMKLVTVNPGFFVNKVYQQFVDKDREFRAMMVGELIAFFMEKHAPTNGDFRWNEHRGSQWTTVAENRRLRQDIRQIGKAALDALHYDFGAVDIIKKGNQLYILEVNSRPEFGPNNAVRFVNAIRSYLEG